MIDPMTGLPTITYGPTFYQLPPLMQQFTYFHECAHLVEQTSNEFVANCRALQLMKSQGLSPAQESAIASIHMNIGPLPPQYGGSGAFFGREPYKRAHKVFQLLALAATSELDAIVNVAL
ncbi:hypothetical protein [Pseudomonas putida]|uniref:hypothetical protein n=1 Tax=Pseudomonas putida TaxID=303 RepID=UPI003F79733B